MLKNNLAIGNVTGGSVGGWDFTSNTLHRDSTNNCSSDGTALNMGAGIDSQTGARTFVDPSTDNFHLRADAPCRGAGVVLVDDPFLSFVDDMDGDARPLSGWDTGADQY